jgi:hypothetical protein
VGEGGGEEEGNAQGENLVVILMKRTAYQYGSFSSEFSNRKKKEILVLSCF